MIKNIAFRLIRLRVKKILPLVNSNLYKKLFTLSYKFFIFIKPSQLWIILLALLNKTDLKGLIRIPSIFILFSSIFSESGSSPIKEKALIERLEINKFIDKENNWENFFLILICLALIKRFTVSLFKFLWLPFKIALIYYILNYFGFDFSYAYNILNNLSLGTIDWFHDKLTNFLETFNSIWKN
jgi:hypothetical protein